MVVVIKSVDLGSRIKDLRDKEGISQEVLAKAVGSTGATISEIESGKRAPRVKLLIAIADYFNVSADYLLGRAARAEDLPEDLRELFQLAVDAGYAADLKDFFRWLKAKREQLAAEGDKTRREPDKELLGLIPDLTEDEIKAILLKFEDGIAKRIVQLTPEQTKAFNEEVARILYYLELEAKVKRSGETAEADTKGE
ncbi:MAG: helix-turn-helix transcriptional regulator [Candidatus Zixiibacteriota bacterium]|jgi:transcriptional regulator with XRE-family HTH domain